MKAEHGRGLDNEKKKLVLKATSLRKKKNVTLMGNLKFKKVMEVEVRACAKVRWK